MTFRPAALQIRRPHRPLGGSVDLVSGACEHTIFDLGPVISMREPVGDVIAVVDARTAKGMQDVYGGARRIYLSCATSRVFSSLHTSIGMAFVGAVAGEYLGSAKGAAYLILRADRVFDIDTVFAGMLVPTASALVLHVIVTRVEARLPVWRPQTAQTEAM